MFKDGIIGKVAHLKLPNAAFPGLTVDGTVTQPYTSLKPMKI